MKTALVIIDLQEGSFTPIWADFIAPGGPALVCACADVPVSG